MTETIYLLTICIPAGVVLIIFVMKYRSAGREAQARILTENDFREVARKAVATQAETATALTAAQADLSEIKTRLAAVEKILKAVE